MLIMLILIVKNVTNNIIYIGQEFRACLQSFSVPL